MAIKVLPIQTDIPAFRFRSDLDDTTYEFRFTYNGRVGLWTMDLFDEAGNDLVRGIPVYVKQLLLKQYQYDQQLPQGNLFALNIVNPDSDPDFENFGDDVILFYEEV